MYVSMDDKDKGKRCPGTPVAKLSGEKSETTLAQIVPCQAKGRFAWILAPGSKRQLFACDVQVLGKKLKEPVPEDKLEFSVAARESVEVLINGVKVLDKQTVGSRG